MREDSTKLRDRAYSSFTERLLAREIKPGQFVSQRELVDITGMPLGAIRELIPRLEAEGLITTVPQRGLQIAHVDLNLIRNAFQFRLFIEREATALFARNASDEVIASLKAAHLDIIARAEGGEKESLISDAEATDRMLHETIIEHLENDIISKTYWVNWIKIKIIRQNETRLYLDLVIPVMQDHLKVIEALERREPEAAAQAMTDHILQARNRAINIENDLSYGR
ncbi:MAG: GntR family transcriptional regulator [Rhizobiales bacterium PAR1]|nr:MAG: GntR family transcriptional regulator [Rhizobiales bacterium PAR1]